MKGKIKAVTAEQGRGWAEGVLGEAGCWQGGAAELLIYADTLVLSDGREVLLGYVSPHLVPLCWLNEVGAVLPSSLCLPFPRGSLCAAITQLSKLKRLWRAGIDKIGVAVQIKCSVSTEILFFKTCTSENISSFPMEKAFCPLSIGHKIIC